MFGIKSSRRHSFQPALENLEDRCVPAVLTPGVKEFMPVLKDVGQTSILIGLLKPVNPHAFPAVQSPGWAKGQFGDSTTSILIGLLKPVNPHAFPAVQKAAWAKGTPQPDPVDKPFGDSTNSILIGLLKPGNPQAFPAVQKPSVQVGPQPEPPTKLAPIADSIGFNAVDPQPTPPKVSPWW